jgi:heme A synthase
VLPAAIHVQLTHRVLAFLVVLHFLGLASGVFRRGEASVAKRAAATVASLGVLQLVVAGAMILGHLPPVLRSLHEATGVSVWISAFALAYLARIGSGSSEVALVEETTSRGRPSSSPRSAAHPDLAGADR